ncbi:hypothetical protein DFP94_11059 [Fontibacillus phaseoli]|uniref:Uncharacterized protein n=1 Tax=Fontibacillus phaseoli TaxID=1416533 RepID=A0A369B8S8_9BACL|nr:hypothetical protein DFP94_11059 [Fontibacillus phaseoli]
MTIPGLTSHAELKMELPELGPKSLNTKKDLRPKKGV